MTTAYKKAGSEKCDFGLPWALKRTKTYICEGVSSSDTVYTVLDWTGVPLLGDLDSNNCICIAKAARETEAPDVWEVDVTWASATEGQRGKSPSHYKQDPRQRPSEYQWYTIHYEQGCDVDINGNRIRNSAGDEYDPPLTEDYPRIGLTVTRYETVFYPSIISRYVNRVSSDTFFGFSPRIARCVDISAEEHYENGITCAKVTYKFEFDLYIDSKHPGCWISRIADKGGRYYDANNNLIVAQDDAGTSHGGLVKLDGNGYKLANQDDDPITTDWRTKFEIAFRPLNLEPA